jgi:hypothetical protein
MVVSGENILAKMVEGKGYSRKSFLLMFPGADERLVLDAVAKLTKEGKLWNGNGVTHIKFPQREVTECEGVVIQVGPCHAWGDLTGYEKTLGSHRELSEGLRGENYKARPVTFPAFGRADANSFQARNTAVIKGLL